MLSELLPSIVAMVFCVIMSAYFSATETAFSSLNKTRLKALSEKEQSILRLRLQGKNMSEIATALGYHDASGVKKAIKRIGQKLIDAGVVDPNQLTGRKIS